MSGSKLLDPSTVNVDPIRKFWTLPPAIVATRLEGTMVTAMLALACPDKAVTVRVTAYTSLVRSEKGLSKNDLGSLDCDTKRSSSKDDDEIDHLYAKLRYDMEPSHFAT